MKRHRTCPFCKAELKWLPVFPNGRYIPVNAEPDVSGPLMLDPNTDWLVRAEPTNQERLRYRSHLLDCKKLARAMHKPVITIGKADADEETNGSVARCFRCGEPGHFADSCDNDNGDMRELAFD